MSAPTVPDPVADTARSLAEKYRHARTAYLEYQARYESPTQMSAWGYTLRRDVALIADAARACGPQVYASFCALITGDAGREVRP